MAENVVLYSVKWYKYTIVQLLQWPEVNYMLRTILCYYFYYIPNKVHDNTGTNTNLIQPRP